MTVLLPLLSCLLSLLFAGLVLGQWRRRRHAFQLVWAVGLLFYAVGAGTEFLGGLAGWSPGLYRAWYLGGAFLTAAWLGMGTIYLLGRTGFGYVVGVVLVLGGLISLAATKAYPGSGFAGRLALAVAVVGAVLVVAATAVRRPWSAHVAFGVLLVGSLAALLVVLTAPLAGPGYALDPHTGAPVGSAFPGYARVLVVPFNVVGAFCLVFGAVFSAYVYMPKRKLLAADAVRTPVLAQGWYAVVVAVNFVASLPGAVAALFAGRLNSRVPATILIALGGFVPSVTSGLNRFGITWAFFAGELLGVLLIFAGFLVSEEVFRSVRLPGGVVLRREPALRES